MRTAHKHCATCEKSQSNCLIITFAYASILLDFSLPGVTGAQETGALSDIYSDQESQSPGEDKNKSSSTTFCMRNWSGTVPKVFPFHQKPNPFSYMFWFWGHVGNKQFKNSLFYLIEMLTNSKINFLSGNEQALSNGHTFIFWNTRLTSSLQNSMSYKYLICW